MLEQFLTICGRLFLQSAPVELDGVGCVSSADVDELFDSNNKFAFEFYRELAEHEWSLSFSPLSISTALGMALAGAAGETADEIADVLHLTLPPEKFHPAFGELLDQLMDVQNSSIALNMTGGVWGQPGYEYASQFVHALSVHYGVPLWLADITGDPEGAREQINQQVAASTGDSGTELLPPGSLGSEPALILSNWMRFEGRWKRKFDGDDSRAETLDFRTGSADALVMHQSETFQYGEGSNYQILELPYWGNRLSMIVLLPAPGQFDVVEQSLSADFLNQALADLSSRQIHLHLPKLQLRQTYELSDALTNMGLSDAFDPEAADFSRGDSLDSLFLAGLYHDSGISIDEGRTRITTSTSVGTSFGTGGGLSLLLANWGTGTAGLEFNVNRPFIYALRDAETGSVLLVGRVTDADPLVTP